MSSALECQLLLKQSMAFFGKRTVSRKLPVSDGFLNESNSFSRKDGRLNGMRKRRKSPFNYSKSALYPRLPIMIPRHYQHDANHFRHSHCFVKKIALRIKTKTKRQAHKRIGIAQVESVIAIHPQRRQGNRPHSADDPGLRRSLREKISVPTWPVDKRRLATCHLTTN